MSNQVLPEISIIVPVYNPPEKYLRECLDSLIGQSLKNIEIILIDNASIGGCPQILQEYAARDKRIKLFRFEENQGFSGACNQGIELSVAPYFQIVDSDDILAKSACQKELQRGQAFWRRIGLPDPGGHFQNAGAFHQALSGQRRV